MRMKKWAWIRFLNRCEYIWEFGVLPKKVKNWECKQEHFSKKQDFSCSLNLYYAFESHLNFEWNHQIEDYLYRLENPFILLHEIQWFHHFLTCEIQKVSIFCHFLNFFENFFPFWCQHQWCAYLTYHSLKRFHVFIFQRNNFVSSKIWQLNWSVQMSYIRSRAAPPSWHSTYFNCYNRNNQKI